mgnify:CR=1 FL=1
MFKKILFLAVFLLFAFGAKTQAGEIKASDSPFGYASIGAEQNFGGYAGKESKEVAIQNRQELVKYAKMGGYVIYIDGFIDLAKARSRKMARARGLINL